MSQETDKVPEDTPEAHWKRFEATTRQLFNTPKPTKPEAPKPAPQDDTKETR